MYEQWLIEDHYGQDAGAAAGGGGGGGAGAVGAVLQGAASVVNAITGAVSEGVRQQNEPHILARNKADLFNTKLRQVRTLNRQRQTKVDSIKAHKDKRAYYKRESKKLKIETEKKRSQNRWNKTSQIKAQQKKVDKFKKFKSGLLKGKWKDPIGRGLANEHLKNLKKLHGSVKDHFKENEYKAIIRSIDANGVRRLWDADYIHRGHRINILEAEVTRNEENKKRQDLKAAWGYLTNIVGFAPVLSNDLTGQGTRVLQQLPARDDLIGKSALTTIYPKYLNNDQSKSAQAGRVPIFQRSATLQQILTFFGEGHIGTGVWPEAWLLGLTAAELEALPSPGAPLGAIYDIAMENFPAHYQPFRMVVREGLSVPEPQQTVVAGDGYGGWGEQGVSFLDMTWNWDDTHQIETAYDPLSDTYDSSAFGAAPATAFMDRIVGAIRDGTAKRKIAEMATAATQRPPTPHEAVKDLPPESAGAVKDIVVQDQIKNWGHAEGVPNNPLAESQKTYKPPMSTGMKVGIGVGAVAVLGGLAWFVTRK